MNSREILVERFEDFVVNDQHQLNVARALIGVVRAANVDSIR